MTVLELIDQLKDCRGDADVFSVLFDNDNNMDLVIGLDNRGNYVVIYEKIPFDSKRHPNNIAKPKKG